MNLAMFAFRHTMASGSTKLKTNPREGLAFNRATTITQKNLSRPILHMLQKKAVNRRYTRKSQTITHSRELCSPVTQLSNS